jgi:hypothetical protein
VSSGYLNVHLLSNGKINRSPPLYVDILRYQQSIYHYHTTEPAPIKLNHKRGQGGLMLLIRPEDIPHTRVLFSDTYNISFQLDNQVVQAVYWPPTTLTQANLMIALNTTRSADYVIGDMNVSGNSLSKPFSNEDRLERRDAILRKWMKDGQWIFNRPLGSSGLTVDHLMGRYEVTDCQYLKLLDIFGKSDHGYLRFSFVTNVPATATAILPQNINLSLLTRGTEIRRHHCRQMLIETYNPISAELVREGFWEQTLEMCRAL